MATNVVWNGTTYSIPDSGELNWSSLSTFLVALGNNAAIAQEMKQAVRTVTTTPDTVSDTADFAVFVNVTSGPATINLPAGTEGRIFCIGDISGSVVSGARPITIDPNGVQTINGQSTFVIEKDRQFVLIQFTGTNWTILASYVASGQIVPEDLRLTTKGGLITSNGTSPVVLSPGANGTALVADSAEVSGLRWGSLVTDPTTTRGDLIRRGASALERLAAVTNNRVVRGNGTDVVSGQIDNSDFFTTGAAASASAIGIVTTSAQSFGGLKLFEGGASYAANLRSSEGAGTTTLTSSDNYHQVFNLSAPRTVVLPSTGVVAGQVYTIENLGGSDLTIQSSGLNTIETIATGTNHPIAGRVVLRATQAAPTTAGHWRVLDVYDTGNYTTTPTGAVTNTAGVWWVRRPGVVTMTVTQASGTASASPIISLPNSSNPPRIRPNNPVLAACVVRSGGNQEVGQVSIGSTGTLNFYRTVEVNNFTGISGIGNNRTTFSYSLTTDV